MKSYFKNLLSKDKKVIKKNSSSDKNQLPSISLTDDKFSYNFVYHTQKELNRINRLFDKEKGTIAWLNREIKPDDIFYDIGANIGLYTIFAGRRLGKNGRAVAFEPHIPNANSLLHNIFLNQLENKIELITLALTHQQSYNKFNYHALNAGTSTSQYGRNSYDGLSFNPIISEIKHGCSLDLLCQTGLIKSPTIIKIDVDGIEFEILKGMHDLLSSAEAPRTIQVELGNESKKEIIHFLKEMGYTLKEKHWTQAGLDFINQGNDPEDYPHNGIFYHASYS